MHVWEEHKDKIAGYENMQELGCYYGTANINNVLLQ